jgi:hypothetical protein
MMPAFSQTDDAALTMIQFLMNATVYDVTNGILHQMKNIIASLKPMKAWIVNHPYISTVRSPLEPQIIVAKDRF